MSGPAGEAEGRLRDQAEILSASMDLLAAKAEFDRLERLVARLAHRLVADPLATDEEAVARALPEARRELEAAIAPAAG